LGYESYVLKPCGYESYVLKPCGCVRKRSQQVYEANG